MKTVNNSQDALLAVKAVYNLLMSRFQESLSISDSELAWMMVNPEFKKTKMYKIAKAMKATSALGDLIQKI